MQRRYKLGRFLALERQQQLLLAGAAFWLPIFSLRLRILGFPKLQATRKPTTNIEAPASSLLAARETGKLVNIAARHTIGSPTCLSRSLVLQWLLRMRGIPSQLRIGVRLSDGTLTAHAWVECGGEVINDTPEHIALFCAFDDLTSRPPFQTQ